MRTKILHPVQEKLLFLLGKYIDDPMTVRELQNALGVTSTSIVAHHVRQLEKKGYLKRNPYNSKDYQIVKGRPERQISYLNLYKLIVCDVDGSILGGNPIDRIPIASRLFSFPAAKAFMIIAKGKSMEPKIQDGDLVIARKVSQPENGKLYVCVNNGKALIKRFQQDGKTKILCSLNPNFEPFVVAKDFHIEGEVKVIISRKVI